MCKIPVVPRKRRRKFLRWETIGEARCCDAWMAERTHYWTERWSSLWVSLSLSVSLCLLLLVSLYLSLFPFSVSLSLSLPLSPSLSLSFCLSPYLPYLSICLSVCLPLCLYVYLSICLRLVCCYSLHHIVMHWCGYFTKLPCSTLSYRWSFFLESKGNCHWSPATNSHTKSKKAGPLWNLLASGSHR